mmetsp:Transcript_31087/g.30543  ORF Transcript_31087/g.30543 Transcript_31087/m.30543 type:complete len:81 (+) Transcript_31087:381-623(+)
MFSHPSSLDKFQAQPKYKNYNQRVDIITGQLYDQNKRSYPFEGFNEESQKKQSKNVTTLPQDLYLMDPITGRKIMQRVPY